MHLETITQVTQEALKQANTDLKSIDLIAATKEPGLFGSLLVGKVFGEALSLGLNKPLVFVNHIHAHLYAPWFGNKLNFPYMGLVVSGGHTTLFKVRDFDDYKKVGETLDDAAGEAFDKAAKILNLGYPGGPLIDKLAKKGDKKAVKFSCEGKKDSFDFSFSGIKTSLLYKMRDKKFVKMHKLSDVAASFQASIVETIAKKTFSAMKKFRMKELVIGGGVVANSYLRKLFSNQQQIPAAKIYLSDFEFCTDNAAMIAGLGYRIFKKSEGRK